MIISVCTLICVSKLPTTTFLALHNAFLCTTDYGKQKRDLLTLLTITSKRVAIEYESSSSKYAQLPRYFLVDISQYIMKSITFG